MSDKLRPLLASWPVVMNIHFRQRSEQRGYQQCWFSLFWESQWSPAPSHADRFVAEAQVSPGNWWRLVFSVAGDEGVIRLITVVPISQHQVSA